MGRLMILLMVLTGLITAEDPIKVKAHLGSDLLLPVAAACGNDDYVFDVFRGSQRIGVYDGKIKEMSGYEDRLAYDENCTLTLKGLHKEDGTTFTVTLYISKDGRLTQSDIKYEVILQVPATSPPNTPVKDPTPVHTTYNTSQVLSYDILGFMSFCLSLDSLVNAITLVLRFFEYRKELIQHSVNLSCHINIFVTILSQISSIVLILISSGISLSWLLILFPAIPMAGLLLPYVLSSCPVSGMCCRDEKKSSCKELALKLWNVFLLILQVVFPLCIGLLHFIRGDGSSVIGYAFLSALLSVILRTGVFVGALCYNSHCKAYTSVAREMTGIFPNDPGEDRQRERESPV